MADEQDMPGLGSYAQELLRRRDARYSRSWKRQAAAQFDDQAKRPVGNDFDWVDKACAALVEKIADLTDYENVFVSELAGRLGRYERKTMVTRRSLGKLREIARKYNVETHGDEAEEES